MTIFFYVMREEPYGCFSNFSPHGVQLDNLWWPTVEHFFQAQKFHGTAHTEQIRSAKTPKDAANLGRDRSKPLRPDWEAVKDGIMLRAVLCKFQNHPTIREILLATSEEEIVENAPGDYYWGCGKDGSGKNMLGITLMKVRDILNNPVAQK